MTLKIKKFRVKSLLITLIIILAFVAVGLTTIKKYSFAAFLKSKGYTLMSDSGAEATIRLPKGFDEVRDDVNVGEILKEANELSKVEGLDFSSYLGKEVTLKAYGLENKEVQVVGIFYLGKIVGYWEPSNPIWSILASSLEEK
ncbi:DUF4830 domain-containing protein [Clostridium vincentii]|uniref:DUF4830 domain-containing protein n=1 Tax=Clostridium vincentii TaxID=52704 RepID=A0A2T0BF22_9CLOT|nr:DUF4830 domain-containing protein [Clostridium vincentii]PRR82501.1 hypothetical protein CLVI_16360 [Clostridium vincentii]